MIIQSLEIEHFGKFRNLSLSLNPGINILSGENEAGKTTIAVFIKAMLFGLEPGSEELRRFLPYNSDGVYGGSIVILSGARPIRITRSFFPGRESLTVIDEAIGDVIEYPEEMLGRILGGVTREDYEAAAFVSELGLADDLAKYRRSPEKDELRERQILAPEEPPEEPAEDPEEELQRATEELDDMRRDLRQKQEALRNAQIVREARISMSGPSDGEETGSDDLEEKREQLVYLKRTLEEIVEKGKRKPSGNVLGTVFFVLAVLAALVVWFIYTAAGESKWTLYTEIGTGAGALFVLLGLFFTVFTVVRNHSISQNVIREKVVREHIEAAEWEYQESLEIQKKRMQGGAAMGDTVDIDSRTREIEELSGRIRRQSELVRDIAERARSYDGKAYRYDVSVPEIRRINDLATRIFSRLGGASRSIEIFGGEALVFTEDGLMIPAEELSQATRQSVFLSIRLAKADTGGDAEALPVILDDIFANLDGDRLKNAMDMLREISGQILILSCQKREQMEL